MKRKIEITFNDKTGITAKSNSDISKLELMQTVLLLLRNLNCDDFGSFINLLQEKKDERNEKGE